MTYADKIKAKIKESDVEARLSGLVDEGEKLLNDSVARAGDLAHERRDDVNAWLEKASSSVNEKTEGKYAEKVDRIRDALLQGWDKLAERRTGGSDATDGEPADPREIEPPSAG